MFTKLILIGFKIFNRLYSIGMIRPYLFFYDIYKYISDYSDIRRIKGIVRRGSVVVDAGANVGFYTRLFSKLVGDQGSVIAFEPDDKNFRILKARTDQLKNVKIVKAALSDQSGKIDLYISKDLNVDHQTYDSGENREKIQIDCFSLDDYCKENGIGSVTFIKMDLQGYDAIALRGMKDTIQRNKNIKLCVEFWPHGMRKAGVEPEDMIKLIQNLNLRTDFNHLNSVEESFYVQIWLS